MLSHFTLFNFILTKINLSEFLKFYKIFFLTKFKLFTVVIYDTNYTKDPSFNFHQVYTQPTLQLNGEDTAAIGFIANLRTEN